tara:strand:+ start:5888 stop:7456 length:1569 start_codon:yes stop_codon:yes gene_type:complete
LLSVLVRAGRGTLLTLTLGIAVLTMGTSPAHAEWRRAESPHFIVYGDMSEQSLRDYTRKIERFDAMLRHYYPNAAGTVSSKLEIYIADGLSELRQINPTLRSGIGGFYSAGDSRVFAVVDQRRSEGDRTLFHEYGHHFMLANMPGAYPGWFVEGFAEYHATAEVTSDRARIGMHSRGRMNSLVQSNSWVPMEAVLGSRSAQLTSGQGPGYYAQAWALTSYLMSTPERKRRLGLYLAAVASGADPIAALDGTIDRTPSELQGDLQSYLRRITYFTVPMALPTAEVTVSVMPTSARDLIWLDLRVDRFVAPADKAELLDRIRSIAARYPGDRLAGIVLAKIQLSNDDPRAAEATLAPILVAAPADADALRLTARARMTQAAADEIDPAERDHLYAQARTLLGRAYRSDPEDYRILMALADSRMRAFDYPTDNDLDTLDVAVQLAPQVSTVRYRAAQALMARDFYPEVIALLEPVANNPHGGDSLAPVRALLGEARQRAGLAARPDEPLPIAPDAGEEDPDASGE